MRHSDCILSSVIRHYDSEWGEISIEHRQFIGTLVVLPLISHGKQDFDLLVHVRVVIPGDTSPSNSSMHHETIGTNRAFVREALDGPGEEIVLILKHPLFVH